MLIKGMLLIRAQYRFILPPPRVFHIFYWFLLLLIYIFCTNYSFHFVNMNKGYQTVMEQMMESKFVLEILEFPHLSTVKSEALKNVYNNFYTLYLAQT